MFCRIDHTKKDSRFLFVLIVSLMLLNNSIALGNGVGLKRGQVSSKKLRSMARIYMAYGEYEKAQPLMEQALASARKTNTADYELAMCLIDTACLYNKQNKLTYAEELCKQGLELQQKFLYEKHPHIAYTLRILSSINMEQGKLDEAKSALDEATSIMSSSHSEDDYGMISLEIDKAKLLVAQGNLGKAESLYSHALSVIDRQSPNHFYKAGVLEDMAELYLLQKKYAEAESRINQVLSIKEEIYGFNHPFLVSALFIKAYIEREKGNYTASEEFIQRALATVKTTENITQIVEVQRRAEEIRDHKVIANRLIAKAVY